MIIGVRSKKRLSSAILYVFSILFCLIISIPFLWMVSCSLQTDFTSIFSWPPKLIPASPRFQNYLDAIKMINMPLLFKNTMIVVLCSMFLSIGASILVAYGFARFKAPGKEAFFVILLSTMMLPWVVTMVPGYIIFLKWHWVGTLLPLIIPNIGGSAFYIFLLRQFIMGIPHELDEAATIDGCGRMRILWSILIPQCKPVLATITIFSFTGLWSDFVGPSIYLTDPSMYTLSIGLQLFRSTQSSMPWNLVMAACLIFSLPMVVVLFAAQNAFTKGIVMSGIKG